MTDATNPEQVEMPPKTPTTGASENSLPDTNVAQSGFEVPMIDVTTPIARNDKGHWLPGQTGNPEGKNAAAARTNIQPVKIRIARIKEKFPTTGDIKRVLKAENSKEFDELGWEDSMLVRQIGMACGGSAKEAGKERERLTDRLEGTPVQTVKTGSIDVPEKVDVDKMTDEEAARYYEQRLKD